MFTPVSKAITPQATSWAELSSNVEQAVGHVGLSGRRQQFAKGNPRQHVGLAQPGHQHAEVLGKGNRHGGIEAVLDDEELRPAEEERPEVAVGFAEEDVLAPGVRIHGGQLRAGYRAEHGEQAAENPQADEHPGVATHCAMIDSPMKMPEPIIEPTTMVVASKSRRCRWSWGGSVNGYLSIADGEAEQGFQVGGGLTA